MATHVTKKTSKLLNLSCDYLHCKGDSYYCVITLQYAFVQTISYRVRSFPPLLYDELLIAQILHIISNMATGIIIDH